MAIYLPSIMTFLIKSVCHNGLCLIQDQTPFNRVSIASKKILNKKDNLKCV